MNNTSNLSSVVPHFCVFFLDVQLLSRGTPLCIASTPGPGVHSPEFYPFYSRVCLFGTPLASAQIGHLQGLWTCQFLDPTRKTPTVQKSTREAFVGAVIKLPRKASFIYLFIYPCTLVYKKDLSAAVLGSLAGKCFLISTSAYKIHPSCWSTTVSPSSCCPHREKAHPLNLSFSTCI